MPALPRRAADDLRFIREAMERSSSFTVPGRAGLLMGAIGCAGAIVASGPGRASATAWLSAWFSAATLACLTGTAALYLRARAAGTPMLRGAGARFFRGLCPPLAAGALITVALVRAGAVQALPSAWLLCYGTALLAAGVHSIPVVRAMGASFLAVGAAAALAPAGSGDLFMALGFGGLHAGFGFWILRRHGG